MRARPARIPARRPLGRRLTHLARILGAGLFLASCGVASYNAGARHRAEPAADRAAGPVCPR